MTDEQLLELAKTYGFDEFVGEKDDETDGVYWQCWEEQLLKFARAIYHDACIGGYDEGVDMIIDAGDLYDLATEIEAL
tara:strand:- start:432 stop:665 length:234 start_codon:yes stop_codon:yes gene_type:complete